MIINVLWILMLSHLSVKERVVLSIYPHLKSPYLIEEMVKEVNDTVIHTSLTEDTPRAGEGWAIERINEREVRIYYLFEEDLEKTLDNLLYQWPLPHQYTTISSGFGIRRDPFNPSNLEWHTGIDIPCPYGTPVYSVTDGEIKIVGHGKREGVYIIIKGDDGREYIYAHLSELHIKRRGRVRKGEIIGFTGKTGRITGPHLHFGVKERGKFVDPMRLEFFKDKNKRKKGGGRWENS